MIFFLSLGFVGIFFLHFKNKTFPPLLLVTLIKLSFLSEKFCYFFFRTVCAMGVCGLIKSFNLLSSLGELNTVITGRSSTLHHKWQRQWFFGKVDSSWCSLNLCNFPTGLNQKLLIFIKKKKQWQVHFKRQCFNKKPTNPALIT